MNQAQEREIAPKRKRMLDMIMVLGGLKEESAVPLSKVKEELQHLRSELEPIMGEILEFPEMFFAEFIETAERLSLIDEVNDQGVLNKAISDLKQSLDVSSSPSLEHLLEHLTNALGRFEEKMDETEVTTTVDFSTTISEIPEIIARIDEGVSKYEIDAKAEAEAAREELERLVNELQEILTEHESQPKPPLDLLDSFQKLGTKTRYGPFLRIAAQIKRGVREGRISEGRSVELVSKNALIELYRGLIMHTLNKMGSKTTVQLAETLDVDPSLIQSAIVSMLKRGEIEMVGLDGDAPLFSRVLGKTPSTTLSVKAIIQQLRVIRSSVEGEALATLDECIKKLGGIFGRLQILGEYDENPLSEPVNQLREIVNSLIEATMTLKSTDDAEDLRLLVSAGLEAFARFRLKITLEKGPYLVSDVNAYGEQLDPERYAQIMDSYLENEIERSTLLILIRELGAMTAEDLAERTGFPQDRVFRHLLRMKRDELLTIAGERHGYILYDVPRTPNEAEVILQTVTSIAPQIANARKELESSLKDIKAEDIGRLANALEVFSNARDKMSKISVKGVSIAEQVLKNIKDKIHSAVVLAYRTRAKLPSTRSKVTIEDLVDVDVPTVLDEYRDQMGYAPLLGFGTINWDHSKCLGCKSCEISCPEDAILLKPIIKVSNFFELTGEALEKLPKNKSLFYQTVQNLAAKKPIEDIVLENDIPGFGTIEVDLWLCVACRTCVRRCPGVDEGALELELKWSLPEVVRHLTTESQ